MFYILPYAAIVILFACMALNIRIRHHPVIVTGSSMEPTYESMDVLETTENFTDADIKYNTVICFSSHRQGTFIKRVVGLPGDHVFINNNGLYINGRLVKDNLDKPSVYGTFLDLTLKDGEYYVLGDNREDSTDSRILGPIKRQDITNVVKGKISPKELIN